MVLASKKFGGRADCRCKISMIPDHLIQPSDNLRIRDVLAVPRQKIVDSVPRRNGDVTGIRRRFPGNDSAIEDLLAKPDGVVVLITSMRRLAACESPLPVSLMTNSEMNTEKRRFRVFHQRRVSCCCPARIRSLDGLAVRKLGMVVSR